MSDFIQVYITTEQASEAAHIARTIVEEGLAACANIMPGVQSIYRWHGQSQETAEVVLLVKTRANYFDALAMRVKHLHSASVPCIVALPLVEVAADYRAWLESTLPATPPKA